VSDAQRSIEGELTFATVPDRLTASKDWFAGPGELVFDLAGVTRADSAGLSLLIEWLRLARQRGLTLRYRNLPEQLLTLVRVNGLTDTLLNGAG
jgi:phospholipid transport system transporter-binding protein